MLIGNLYNTYLERLRNHQGGFSMGAALPEQFRIAQDGRLSTFYAPFDALNTNARVVLVGITPGLQQAVNALNAAKSSLDSGASPLESITSAKATASFSGSMRGPLIEMLDHVGLNTYLGLNSCGSLFGERRDLLHSTSILRYPVFHDGKNYSGTPSMVRSPFLRSALEAQFPEEARALKDAVFIPLGPKVSEALHHLTEKGLLDKERILSGLPHPSGANAERIKYFLGRKPATKLSNKTNPEKIDAAKAALIAKIQKLSGIH